MSAVLFKGAFGIMHSADEQEKSIRDELLATDGLFTALVKRQMLDQPGA